MIKNVDIKSLTERNWFYLLVYSLFMLISKRVARINGLSQPTPKRLKIDLAWIWAVLLAFALYSSTWLVFQDAPQWVGIETGYFLALSYGYIVYRAGSAKCTVISHREDNQ